MPPARKCPLPAQLKGPRPQSEPSKKPRNLFVGKALSIVGDENLADAAQAVSLKVYGDASRICVEAIPDKLGDGGDGGRLCLPLKEVLLYFDCNFGGGHWALS